MKKTTIGLLLTLVLLMAVTINGKSLGQNRVNTPSFSPPAGIYPTPQQITISTSTSGTVIHYTRNGIDPIERDSIYTNPINIAFTTTIKARAYKSGMDSSVVATGVYEIRNLRLGNVHYVPDDYLTIQSAVDSSQTWDTVLVRPGIYGENVALRGKNIIVASMFLTTNDTNYISNTIIDGNKTGSVVTVNQNESLKTVICGFTIMNGLAKSGGGIMIDGASPSLKNLIIKNNKAYGTDMNSGNSFIINGGGGIFCNNSNCSISNVAINDNIASGNGGGVFLNSSNTNIRNVSISKNMGARAGGMFIVWESVSVLCNLLISQNSNEGLVIFRGASAKIINATIAENSGDGLYYEGFPNVINSTIVNNLGYGINSPGLGIMRLFNSIIWGNKAANEIYVASAGIYVNYSDIKGGETGIDAISGWIKWQEGNIGENPKFSGVVAQSYQLTSTSPCINAGMQDTAGLGLPPTDLAGNPRIYGGWIDMGAYEYQGEWGAYQFNKEISVSLASNADTLFVPFSKTKLSMIFHTGEPMGKVFKITGYGSSISTAVFNNKTFARALGYYSIKSDSVFQFNAELAFSYSDSLLNGSGISKNNLEIAFWDDSALTWKALPTTVDVENKIASAEISHLSLWALTDKTDALLSHVQEQGSTESINTFELYSNYPNPFNPATTIHFRLPQDLRVRLTIYNVLGQSVRALINKNYSAGEHTVQWDGKDDSDVTLSSGVYIYELRAGSFVQRKKMTLLR